MQVEFVVEDHVSRTSGYINYNPRDLVEKLLPVFENYKEIKKVKIIFRQMYGELNIYLYREEDDKNCIMYPERQKSMDFYEKILNEINEQPGFCLNRVNASIRGWSEYYFIIGLSR